MASKPVSKIAQDISSLIDSKLENFKTFVRNCVSNHTIDPNQIQGKSITTSKLGDGAVIARNIKANAVEAEHVKTNSIEGRHLTLSAKESVTTSQHNLLKDSIGPFTSDTSLIKEFNTTTLLTSTTYTFVVYGSVNIGQQVSIKFNDGADGTDTANFTDGYAIIRTTTPASLSNTNVRIYNTPSETATDASIEWACMYKGTITSPPLDWNPPYEDVEASITLEVERGTPYEGVNPPSDPTSYKGWINTGVNPSEYLRWTGNSSNIDRRYSTIKTGTSLVINDLSDIHAFDVTVKTVSSQSGSGTPSFENIRTISGKSAVNITINETTHTLTPTSNVYGVTGAEDEISNNGVETHKTSYSILDGTETWALSSIQPSLTTLVSFSIAKSDIKTTPLGACSHFSWITNPSTSIESEAISGNTYTQEIIVFILKSRMSGWSDAWTDATKIAAFKSVLAGQVTSATSVQVVYELATALTYTNIPTVINGEDGSNSITTNGSSITIGYTGSGWELISGKANSLAISADMKFNADGLRIDQTLYNGNVSVDTYFHAGAQDQGLYRKADDVLVQGGKVLPDGRVIGVTSGIIDPDGNPLAYYDTDTNEDGYLSFRLMAPSYNITFDNAVSAEDIVPTNSEEIFSILGVSLPSTSDPNMKIWETESYITLRASGDLGVVSDGTVDISGANGIKMNGCLCDGVSSTDDYNVLGLAGHFDPLDAGLYNLGLTSRWKRLYCTLSPDVSSDERLKRDIEDINTDLILHLRPIQYRLKSNPSKLQYGFSAQQVKTALDECGIIDADLYGDENPDSLSLRYEQFISPLISTVQKQQKKIEELENRILKLESLIGNVG